MTPWRASTSAAQNASPPGTLPAEGEAPGPSSPRPPKAKKAAVSATKARVLTRLVKVCARLPQRTPTHCRSANVTTDADATARASEPASAGTTTPAYSPTTSATAASVPHVESQSLQPTTKLGYSPNARRAKT